MGSGLLLPIHFQACFADHQDKLHVKQDTKILPAPSSQFWPGDPWSGSVAEVRLFNSALQPPKPMSSPTDLLSKSALECPQTSSNQAYMYSTFFGIPVPRDGE